MPGTVFYDKVKEELRDKSNWTDSDDLDMMFKNTYKPEFYKQLQRYIHRRYKKHIAYESAKKIFFKPTKQNLKNTLSLIKIIPQEFLEKLKLKQIEPDATAKF